MVLASKRGGRVLMRFVAFVMMLLVMVMPILIPAAQAIVIEAATVKIIEIIATVIIGSGFVFRAVEDARAAAGQIWDWIQTNKADIATFFTTWATQYSGLDRINKGIRVSGQVIDAIKEAVSALTTVDASGQYFGTWQSSTLNSLEQAIAWNADKDWYATFRAKPIHEFRVNGDVYSASFETGSCRVDFRKNGQHVSFGNWGDIKGFSFSFYSSDRYGSSAKCLVLNANDTVGTGTWFMDSKGTALDKIYDYPIILDIPDVVINVSGDIVYPSDDYIVKAPDLPDVQTGEDGKEVVVYPDLSLNPADHLADIPLDETGEKVGVPYDVIVDTTTGEQIDVDNPDIPDNPDVPDVKPDTGQGILDKLKDFFDSPSDFKLNFDGFKNLILPDRFPFCIPFDLVNSIKVFAANAQDFHFRIDLDTQYWSVHHEVDLTPFAIPFGFFRYCCVIWFGWILITRTRDMIKW